jgi:hypothetical protein
MRTHSITVSFCVLLGVFAPPGGAHAQGFHEVPEPGEIGPPKPAPERYLAGAGMMLVLPLGRAREQVSQSLGWSVGLVRWLRPWLGVAASGRRVLVAKRPSLPANLDVTLHTLAAGVRFAARPSREHSLFAEASLGVHTKTLAQHNDRRTARRLGARITAGARKHVGTRIHLGAQIGYSAAILRTVSFELTIARSF